MCREKYSQLAVQIYVNKTQMGHIYLRRENKTEMRGVERREQF